MPGVERPSRTIDPDDSNVLFPREKRNYARPKMLEAYVADAISSFNSKESASVPTPGELAELYGYKSVSAVVNALRRGSKLYHELEKAYREMNIVYPSSEWAWMLGLLALGGSTSFMNQQVSLVSADPYLLEAFGNRGTHLFQTNPNISVHGIQKDGREAKKIYFGNAFMVRAIGDIRREAWPQTISEKHGWIYTDDEYLLPFLSAAIEVRGNISDKPQKRRIVINTTYRTVANTILDYLVRAGIQRPRIKTDNSAREGIKGIEVNKASDVKRLAQMIYSVNPEREQVLDKLRALDVKSPAKVYSVDEVSVEWARLVQILGRNPNSEDINRLYQSGETLYSVKVYINWSGTGSWSEAAKFFAAE